MGESKQSVAAIIQARMGATRLPGKVLADVNGASMLARVVQRVQRIALIDTVVVATTAQPEDDKIVAECKRLGVKVFRGSEEDVLDRYYQAATQIQADHIVRICADDPLVCFAEAERVITHHLASGADYTHNIAAWGSGLPLGTGCEVFTFAALEASWSEGQEPHHREHVDEYIYEHPEKFRIEMLIAPPGLRHPEFRLTVDTAEDLEFIREIYRRLSRPNELITLWDVIKLLDHEPGLSQTNKYVAQKPT